VTTNAPGVPIADATASAGVGAIVSLALGDFAIPDGMQH
jgi:hypothetical protein